MFMLRRIIFAAVIVYMDEMPLWGTLIFMFSTLCMLAYVLTEQQWKNQSMNRQHIFNEITLYLFSVLMLCFSNLVTPLMRYTLGFVLIGAVFLFATVNVITMLLQCGKLFILMTRKLYFKSKRKNLRLEAKKIGDHIQIDLGAPGSESAALW
mmetsp:Transcript_237/g.355  ORF Transcript_237/g.355 Transcript_237/m.355 type:complete len:152 (-) Transcript_237:5137-5592(-)